MKILYVTTVGSTMGFFRYLVKELIDEGNVVDIATNEQAAPVQGYYKEWGCKIYQISTSRSPFSFGNIKAINEIRRIAKEYDIVHCHTPLASMATRFACKKFRKKGLKVIYTAHGFHFYKGAPIKNWIIYYPMEKLCSKWTDTIVTINKDDYELSLKKMKTTIKYVPGVGIDVKRFNNTSISQEEKKKELNIPMNASVILSVGELNLNKNHKLVIEALSKINNPNLYYVIAGEGDQKQNLKELAESLNVNLLLLGARSDVDELYHMANLYILPSVREGLNVSIMEAMASGKYVICRDIRGNRDLIDTDGGVLIKDICNVDEVANDILLYLDKGVCNHNIEKANNYSFVSINEQMKRIYKEIVEK